MAQFDEYDCDIDFRGLYRAQQQTEKRNKMCWVRIDEALTSISQLPLLRRLLDMQSITGCICDREWGHLLAAQCMYKQTI